MLEPADSVQTAQQLARLGGEPLDVRPQRCVRVRNRHASCTRCLDACTSGAIAACEGRLAIDETKCVGCGTCATVCPTCALEIRHPNDAALLSSARASMKAQAAEGPTSTSGKPNACVNFACHRATRAVSQMLGGDAVVPLVCLSRVEESMIATLLAEGAGQVVGWHADCQNCPRHDGIVSARLVEQTMAEVAKVWNLGACYALKDATSLSSFTMPAPADESGVRGTSSGLSSEVCTDGVPQAGAHERKMLAHVTHDGTLPHFVPRRRGRLLDALAQLGQPADTLLHTRLWGHVTIDMDACSSCRMCAVFCPTGALCRFQDDDGTMGLEHYVAECVHCLLCQDICPNSAIASSAAVQAVQLAEARVERYCMDAPEWQAGPDQIVRKMEKKISGSAVTASYSTEMGKKEDLR